MNLNESDALQIRAELETVRRLIGLPETHPIERNEIGWTSRVYLVNGGEYVVKFPRTSVVKIESAREEYRREIAVLRLLEAQRLPVRTPRILWTSPDQVYMGYAGIVGTSFDVLAPTATAAQRTAIGEQVGAFLKTLHTLQMADAKTITLDQEIAEFHYKYGLGESIFARDFMPAERQRLDDVVLRELPAALKRMGADFVFSHSDLGYWNMIVTPEGADGIGVHGIIDFGNSGCYDRARDFATLEHEDLCESALRVYGGDDRLRERIALRRRLLPIIDLPYYIGKQDEEGIAEKVGLIRSIL